MWLSTPFDIQCLLYTIIEFRLLKKKKKASGGAGSWCGGCAVLCCFREGGDAGTKLNWSETAYCTSERKMYSTEGKCGRGDFGREVLGSDKCLVFHQQLLAINGEHWIWLLFCRDDASCLCFINGVIHRRNRTHTVQQLFGHAAMDIPESGDFWLLSHLTRIFSITNNPTHDNDTAQPHCYM